MAQNYGGVSAFAFNLKKDTLVRLVFQSYRASRGDRVTFAGISAIGGQAAGEAKYECPNRKFLQRVCLVGRPL